MLVFADSERKAPDVAVRTIHGHRVEVESGIVAHFIRIFDPALPHERIVHRVGLLGSAPLQSPNITAQIVLTGVEVEIEMALGVEKTACVADLSANQPDDADKQ